MKSFFFTTINQITTSLYCNAISN